MTNTGRVFSFVALLLVTGPSFGNVSCFWLPEQWIDSAKLECVMVVAPLADNYAYGVDSESASWAKAASEGDVEFMAAFGPEQGTVWAHPGLVDWAKVMYDGDVAPLAESASWAKAASEGDVEFMAAFGPEQGTVWAHPGLVDWAKVMYDGDVAPLAESASWAKAASEGDVEFMAAFGPEQGTVWAHPGLVDWAKVMYDGDVATARRVCELGEGSVRGRCEVHGGVRPRAGHRLGASWLGGLGEGDVRR